MGALATTNPAFFGTNSDSNFRSSFGYKKFERLNQTYNFSENTKTVNQAESLIYDPTEIGDKRHAVQERDKADYLIVTPEVYNKADKLIQLGAASAGTI